MLIPEIDGGYPSYFVYGTLSFTEANNAVPGRVCRARAAGIIGALIYRGSPLVARSGDTEAFPGERLVVVSSPFFPHKLSKGYDSPFAQVVEYGQRREDQEPRPPGRDAARLQGRVRDHRVLTGGVGKRWCFRARRWSAATDDILTDNGVRSQGSADTLAIWNAKK